MKDFLWDWAGRAGEETNQHSVSSGGSKANLICLCGAKELLPNTAEEKKHLNFQLASFIALCSLNWRAHHELLHLLCFWIFFFYIRCKKFCCVALRIVYCSRNLNQSWLTSSPAGDLLASFSAQTVSRIPLISGGPLWVVKLTVNQSHSK